MTSFVAIAIRTANHKPTSICHISLVVVRHGQLQERMSVDIATPDTPHGAGRTKPTFLNAWRSIAPLIGNLPLVTYNGALCESCLKSIFKLYGLPYPDFTFICTYTVCRKLRFSPALPNYKLSTLAERCGIDPQNLSQAECIAHIALKVL
ncbi:MAG: hypothetical protein IJU72_10210 [Bacteroidales bacterium]|nr:hypothetical protein [Bacteroidales bacterium]